MEFSTVLTLIQTLVEVLESRKLRDAWSLFGQGYESELEKLQHTISTIKAVVLSAENKELSPYTKHYIEQLTSALYEADDLLDEFETLVERKPHMGGGNRFFSRDNQLLIAHKMSQNIEKIRIKLDAIADDRAKFGSSLVFKSKTARNETTSSVDADSMFGREADLEKVVRILIESSRAGLDGSCLFIVGMGGIGKTTLAQLVFNDQRVKDEFPMRMWVWDGDQDTDHWDTQAVLRKILDVVPDDINIDCPLEDVKTTLESKLAQNKYLLVLDDVCNENRADWLKLETLLKGFKGRHKGSQVLVTTRSNETAKIGGNFRHELNGLSDDDSWRLFEMMAFPEVDGQAKCPSHLVEIGREIVRRCANVPLAIKDIGCLLYSQEKTITLLKEVLETGLVNYKPEKNIIMTDLRLSYDNLEPPIKSCFSYCALFPRGFEICKNTLIELWVAQGYVQQKSVGSTESHAESYFSILLLRWLFDNVKKDNNGKIVSFTIHDLMHDIVREVAKNEIFEVNCKPFKTLDNGVKHVSVVSQGHEFIEGSFKKSHIRTYFQVDMSMSFDQSLMGELVTSCTGLRTLNLSGSSFETLPKEIGKLLHLRYLDLSGNNRLAKIPTSVTNLSNLIVLWTKGCENLTHLPLGMGKLTHLRQLAKFMVGLSSSREKQFFKGLDDLRALNNLKGDLEIKFRVPLNATFAKKNRGATEYLSGKKYLSSIQIDVCHVNGDTKFKFDELLLKTLRPHSNLSKLELKGYHGSGMPDWATKDKLTTCLPNLVHLEFSDCGELQRLPWMGRLLHLKILILQGLPKLEYVEVDNPEVAVSTSGADGETFSYFPCLEELKLEGLPKLKRWWSTSPMFPCLRELKTLNIRSCPKMTVIPSSLRWNT